MGHVRSLLSAIYDILPGGWSTRAKAALYPEILDQNSKIQVSLKYSKIPEKKVYWETINLPNVFKQCVQTEIRLKEEVFDPKFYR